MALTFDDITAITNKYYMPKFPQLVFDQNLVQKRLAAKGTKPSSGESIQQPIMHAHTKGGFYDPYGTFDISGEQQITAANFQWKYAEVPITISRDELLKNKGPEGVKKLLDAKMKLASMAMGEILADAMFAITTSTSTDSGTNLHALDSLCEDASNSLSAVSTTYGGLDKASYSWWCGTTLDGTFVSYDTLMPLYVSLADGNILPNLTVMSQESFGQYMLVEQAAQRYFKQSEMDAGFLTASFNGHTVVADRHVSETGATVATNRIYMLNTDFIDFVTHSDENNRLEPFAKPVDQAVGVAHIMWAGELTSSDPSRQGVYWSFKSTAQS